MHPELEYPFVGVFGRGFQLPFAWVAPIINLDRFGEVELLPFWSGRDE
jgi:hypothetical protein